MAVNNNLSAAEMCQQYAEVTAVGIPDFPDAIYERIKGGETTGDSIADELRDFTILRNKGFHPGMAAMYMALQDSVAENVGAQVIFRNYQSTQDSHLGSNGWYRSGLDSSNYSSVIRAGTITGDKLRVERGNVIIPTDEYLTRKTVPKQGAEFSVYHPTEDVTVTVDEDMCIFDYRDDYIPDPAASALLGDLYTEPRPHRYQNHVWRRTVMLAEVWIGNADLEDFWMGEARLDRGEGIWNSKAFAELLKSDPASALLERV